MAKGEDNRNSYKRWEENNDTNTTKKYLSCLIFYLLFFAEDGRIKYKVYFEDKARILLSGHHIASDATPTLEQLYVGARVVVQCQDDTLHYEPAVLAELPGRKNHLRFVSECMLTPKIKRK